MDDQALGGPNQNRNMPFLETLTVVTAPKLEKLDIHRILYKDRGHDRESFKFTRNYEKIMPKGLLS